MPSPSHLKGRPISSAHITKAWCMYHVCKQNPPYLQRHGYDVPGSRKGRVLLGGPRGGASIRRRERGGREARGAEQDEPEPPRARRRAAASSAPRRVSMLLFGARFLALRTRLSTASDCPRHIIGATNPTPSQREAHRADSRTFAGGMRSPPACHRGARGLAGGSSRGHIARRGVARAESRQRGGWRGAAHLPDVLAHEQGPHVEGRHVALR